jgi:8-oxo-dGTP pyrophosphatase MutT (NUDIX family)
MEIIYAGENVPRQIKKSIFLAGPSPRSHNKDMVSWREKAIHILKVLEYDGVVFVPEGRGGVYPSSYDTQIQWETKCLNVADNIFFYINRDIENEVLGLTTNSEFGQWMESGKCVLVTEPTADSVRYQEYWAKELKVPAFKDMYNGLKCVLDVQGEGSYRVEGERSVPLEVWNSEIFQSWYTQLKSNGNSLQDAKVLKTFRIPSNNKLFAFTLWANVYIAKENRYKNNEFVLSRTDISSCLLYYWRPDPLECDIVLVSEYRTPVNNKKGMVYELPGGSSMKEGVDPKQTIIEELHEECGFEPSVSKLEFVLSRQLASTMLTHKSHLYKYRLDQFELEKIKHNQGKTFGNAEDTEMTYVHVVKVRDIINAEYVDWSNIGQILSVLINEN